MKTAIQSQRIFRRAFTLIELLFAISIGLVVAGSVVYLLFQVGREQRRALVNATVEQKAYTLEANITATLRTMSGNQGVRPDYPAGVYTGPSQSIVVFNASTNGSYTAARIQFNPTNGQVIYYPNIATPSVNFLWMTNSATCVLTNLQFSTSLNLDGSIDGSLVNVSLYMNDNGYSQQNPTNNPASVYRFFSVQMRND